MTDDSLDALTGWIGSERIDPSTSPPKGADWATWGCGYRDALLELERFLARTGVKKS